MIEYLGENFNEDGESETSSQNELQPNVPRGTLPNQAKRIFDEHK